MINSVGPTDSECCHCNLATDPVHRWLLTDAFPPEPDRPWFLHRTARAHANDFAMAVGLPTRSQPQEVAIEYNSAMRPCNQAQGRRRGKRGKTSMKPVFRQMQVERFAKYLGSTIVHGGAQMDSS